jgi:hypothetical protein
MDGNVAVGSVVGICMGDGIPTRAAAGSRCRHLLAQREARNQSRARSDRVSLL